MLARETAELLLLVGRLVQAEGYDGELSPAQRMALRYFARANHTPGTHRHSRSAARQSRWESRDNQDEDAPLPG